MSTSVSVSASAAASLPLTGRHSPPASRIPGISRRRIHSKPRLLSSSALSPILPAAAMATDGAAPAASDAGSKKKLLIFYAEEDLAVSMAKYTAELSESGGSLIKALRKLKEPPYLEWVGWSKWHVFWVDERVVPKDHEDSNCKLALDGFLSKVPIPTGQVYAINDALSAEGAASVRRGGLIHGRPTWGARARGARAATAWCGDLGRGREGGSRRARQGAAGARRSAASARREEQERAALGL